MIPHNKTFISSDDLKQSNKILISGKISDGSFTSKFEKNFSKRIYGDGSSVALSSGTAALIFAIKSLKKNSNKKKFKIGIPSYSCSALLNAIYANNDIPVLFDVDLKNFNLSRENINQKCDILICNHTFGSPCDIKSLIQLSPKTKIIEDCCHSLGSEKYSNLGKMGDVSIYSFYATKIVTGGHGGLVWSKNKKLIKKIREFREFDGTKKYKNTFNFKISDFQSAIIDNQLRRLEKIRKKRISVYKRYFKEIKNKFEVQDGFKNLKLIPYRFVLRLKNEKVRDKLKRYFYNNSVKTISPISKFELLHRYLKLSPKNFINSEKIAETSLSIPIFTSLRSSEVKKICKILKNF
jgi:perosamine synthetase